VLAVGEGSSADLLCIQSKGALLGVVASLRQRSLDSFTLEVVTEAGMILEAFPSLVFFGFDHVRFINRSLTEFCTRIAVDFL